MSQLIAPVLTNRRPMPAAEPGPRGARPHAPAETLAPSAAFDGVHFVTALDRRNYQAEGLVLVQLEHLPPRAAGRLAEADDEAIERQLRALGATAPEIGASGDPDGALSDQLFRMRQVGRRSLGLALGSLRTVASANGALEASDSATLLFWARATRERPVVLLLDAGDETLGAHLDPVPLASVLLPRSAAVCVTVPEATLLEEEEGEGEETNDETPVAAPMAVA